MDFMMIMIGGVLVITLAVVATTVGTMASIFGAVEDDDNAEEF